MCSKELWDFATILSPILLSNLGFWSESWNRIAQPWAVLGGFVGLPPPDSLPLLDTTALRGKKGRQTVEDRKGKDMSQPRGHTIGSQEAGVDPMGGRHGGKVWIVQAGRDPVQVPEGSEDHQLATAGIRGWRLCDDDDAKSLWVRNPSGKDVEILFDNPVLKWARADQQGWHVLDAAEIKKAEADKAEQNRIGLEKKQEQEKAQAGAKVVRDMMVGKTHPIKEDE